MTPASLFKTVLIQYIRWMTATTLSSITPATMPRWLSSVNKVRIVYYWFDHPLPYLSSLTPACNFADVRLVNSSTTYLPTGLSSITGILEICTGSTFSGVCDTIDDRTADLACQKLGYTSETCNAIADKSCHVWFVSHQRWHPPTKWWYVWYKQCQWDLLLDVPWLRLRPLQL